MISRGLISIFSCWFVILFRKSVCRIVCWYVCWKFDSLCEHLGCYRWMDFKETLIYELIFFPVTLWCISPVIYTNVNVKRIFLTVWILSAGQIGESSSTTNVSSPFLCHKHTPVSYDVWVSGAGFLVPLSPQVQLAHHPIQLHLKRYRKIKLCYKAVKPNPCPMNENATPQAFSHWRAETFF